MLTLGMARAHWRDLLATAVALTLGVGISAAALMVTASARPQVPARYAGTDVIARAPADGADGEDFPEYRPWDATSADMLAEKIQALPGVEAAVPVRTLYAQLVIDGTPAGTSNPDDPQGRSWSTSLLAPYHLSAGRAPIDDGEIAVSDAYDVTAGDRVPLLTAAGEREVTVTGIVDGPGIYLPDAHVRQLSGGATLIGVVARPGTDAGVLADRITPELAVGVTLMTGADRKNAEPEGTTRTRYLGSQLLTMMLVLACFAAVLVVSQTFALATSHRRRDVALLRALGATPRQLQVMTLREASVIGILCSLVGAVVGSLAAPTLGRALVRVGLEPVGFTVGVNPAVVAGVLVLGPLIAVVSTWATGRRSARVSPLEAIRSARNGSRRLGRWRLVLGILAAAGAVTAAVAAASADANQISGLATVATLATIATVSWLAPIVLPPLVRLVTLPLERGRAATGMLVRGSMTTAVGRTTATMAPVLVTIAFATLVLGYVETGRSAYGGAGLPPGATAVVAPDGTPGLCEDTVDAVRARAGRQIDDTLPTQVFAAGTGATPALGLATVAPGTAVLSDVTARANGWRPGDSIQLTMPDGVSQPLTVARIEPGGDEHGGIRLPRALVREHDGSALTRRMVLSGPLPAQLTDLTRPGVRSLAADEYTKSADEGEYRLLLMFVLVGLGLALGYTLLSIANTLLMATAARARDIGLLRLSGATPRQVLSSLAGESLVTVAIGTGLGLQAGLAGLLGIRAGLARELGRHVGLALPWFWLAVLVAASTVLATVAGVWPARSMVRQPPSSVTRDAME